MSSHIPQMFMALLLVIILPMSVMANEEKTTLPQGSEPFSDLHLRFSNRPLTPPNDLVVQTIPLTGLSVASPFVAPSPQAVIFEDDQRQRLAILSINKTGHLILFLLEPLPLDPKLPSLVQCANNRGCQTDRTPLTGGLGCLALCLKEIFENVTGNPLSR